MEHDPSTEPSTYGNRQLVGVFIKLHISNKYMLIAWIFAMLALLLLLVIHVANIPNMALIIVALMMLIPVVYVAEWVKYMLEIQNTLKDVIMWRHVDEFLKKNDLHSS